MTDFLLVAGARPQFVKAAALLPALRAAGSTLLVHTGQHADPSMVEAHFRDLDLPEPDLRLPAGQADRAARLATMVAGIGEAVSRARPRRVIAMGDTDSTLAAALAASMLGTPLAHVEAGARSFDRTMPEERNRIVADELSDLLLCSTEAHARNLRGRARVKVTGDVMADVLLAREERIRARIRPGPGNYAVLTLHRAGVDRPALARVFDALSRAPLRILFPVHPRTRPLLDVIPGNVEISDPLPYLDFLGLVAGARAVLTDSGGLQKESYLLGVPCVTLRESTEWGETVEAGWNRLCGHDAARIVAALSAPAPAGPRPPLYGDGHAAERIARLVAA